MNNPKISILIPTKNRPQMLKRAIEYITIQDYDNWEALIVDDSNEINEEILKLLLDNPKIKYIIGKKEGITYAMNWMIGNFASGDLFVWHNDDDYLPQGIFKYVVENIGNNEWCYGNIQLVNENKESVGLMGDGNYDYEKLKLGNFIPQPSVYWTKYALEKVGIFDNTYEHSSDYEYWLRLGRMLMTKRPGVIISE